MLQDDSPDGIAYYAEYLDQGQFVDEAYLAGFRDFLRTKYSNHEFDVIVAMGRTAFEFLQRFRASLFGNTPLVFFTDQPSPRPANSTGVVDALNLHGTLALALELQPDLQHVFIVNGGDQFNRAFDAAAREQFKPFQPRVDVTYLSGLSAEEIEVRVTRLP